MLLNQKTDTQHLVNTNETNKEFFKMAFRKKSRRTRSTTRRFSGSTNKRRRKSSGRSRTETIRIVIEQVAPGSALPPGIVQTGPIRRHAKI